MREPPPLPPPEMRQLVGPTDPVFYENPTGDPIYPYLPATAWEAVLDFGCGCGRVARQMMLQHRPPTRYLGIDVHRGMIQWCQENLVAPGFRFEHHDVHSIGFNPDSTNTVLPMPDGPWTLVNAQSVFTHLKEDQATFYMGEVGRVLAQNGVFNSTWFLFDKREFPMMQPFQNALFINPDDLSHAVFFDREWLRTTAAGAGLVITSAVPPAIRGYHWQIVMERRRPGVHEAGLPPDEAPLGSALAPQMPERADRIGLEEAPPPHESLRRSSSGYSGK